MFHTSKTSPVRGRSVLISGEGKNNSLVKCYLGKSRRYGILYLVVHRERGLLTPQEF